MANVPWIKLWGRDCIDDATSRTAQLSNEHFGMWVKLLWGLARCPQDGKGYLANSQPVPDSVWRGLLQCHHHSYSRFLSVVIDELHLFYRDSNGAICVNGDISKSVPPKDLTVLERKRRQREREKMSRRDGHGDVTSQPDPDPDPDPEKTSKVKSKKTPIVKGLGQTVGEFVAKKLTIEDRLGEILKCDGDGKVASYAARAACCDISEGELVDMAKAAAKNAKSNRVGYFVQSVENKLAERAKE